MNYYREVTSAMAEEEEEVTCSMNTEQQKDEIPSDVCTLEILPNVPASSLQTFKAICKNWRQLIASPGFVRLHLSTSIRTRTRTRILMTFYNTIVEYNSSYKQRTDQIPYPPQFCGKGTKIAGSADGLVCLLDQKLIQRWPDGIPGIAAVFNPSTRKCFSVQLLSLPSVPEDDFYIILSSWFGNVGGEYILVLGLFTMSRHYECGVYKFTSNNISCIHSIPVALNVTAPWYFPMMWEMGAFDCIVEERGTFVHGVVYWPVLLGEGQFRYSISAYDIHKNKHEQVSPPLQCDFRLGVIDECLLAVVKNDLTGVFELWIMIESWTKCANIKGFNNFRVLSPLGLFPDGDIILDARSRLFKYNFKDNEATLLREYDCKQLCVLIVWCLHRFLRFDELVLRTCFQSLQSAFGKMFMEAVL